MKCRLIPYIQTFLLAVSFTFCSCEDDLLQERDYSSSEYICFDTELIDVFATATTRSHSEHLMMESEDWVIEGKIANTRVAPTTSLSGTAGVIAYKDAAKSPVTEISDVSFTFDNEVLSPSGFPIPWSKVDGASTLHVFSYAPYDVVHGGSAAATINTGTASPTLTFTVPDAVGSQVDLIAASADVLSGSFRTSVPLTYDHVLTAVRFKVDFACKVKSLTINGVNNTGIYTIGGAWGSQSGSQNYTFGSSVFGESGTDVAANAFVTDGANTLMLMPQTVPAGAQVQLEYSEDDGANWTTLTAYINGHEWQKGKRITYTISKTSVNYIYFDLAAGPVTILDGTYTGYIYQKNGAETATITGSHNDANKYYVYQSSTVTGSAGYFTGTGYEETSGTVRIPSYPETMQDSKTWSEYITNNKDLPGVITNWDAAAAGAKRSVTPNYIKICGSSGHVMDVDITLDNVWSSYHKNVSHRSSGGFLIGPGVIETGAQFQDKSRIAYEKVTLRLKGDNHFHNILYWSGTNSSFKITSADGDKSAKGSLTVTFPNTTEELNGACTVFGSGDNDDTPPCTNMSFEGGTIYVGGSVKVKASDSTGILGGGTNNNCNITFNGGVVTSVAYSNGAAIGGGGGHGSGGGSGTITVNGGKIYAYQFGSYSGSNYLSTAAIGGGSSYTSAGSNGNVTITGGEVYAESIGGAAIGGGSSHDLNGGAANVTITGGYVVAKSIAGFINGNAVTVSNAIGGGKGGTGASSGYGGSATLTISGGTLLSGSVGGGGTISSTANIGTAVVNISGTAVVQGQFIMASGASTSPTFTMTGGTLRKSTSGVFQIVKSDGGAVYIEDGTFSMSGGTIRGFSADKGGAVYVEDGSFTMTGGTIEDCSANYGGAVYIGGGTVNISDGTISNNRSSNSGGGVFVDNGSFTMSAGSITGNYAVENGGGVSVSSSTSNVTVNITGGSITSNSAGEYGGGLSVVPDASYDATVILGVASQGLTNPDISENSAIQGGGGVYAYGSDAAITINSGKIKNNTVSALAPNPDVANDGGMVTLNDGDVTHVVVTYHMNDGSIPETTATQKIVTSTRSVLNMPSWSITGYSLSWNTNADGSGDTYTNEQEVNLTSGLHLYAIWTPNED